MNNETLKNILWGIVIIIGIIFLFGFGDGFFNPKVDVTFRESMIGAGYVARVTNIGHKTLYNVTLASNKWKRGYTITEKLTPGETKEIG